MSQAFGFLMALLTIPAVATALGMYCQRGGGVVASKDRLVGMLALVMTVLWLPYIAVQVTKALS